MSEAPKRRIPLLFKASLMLFFLFLTSMAILRSNIIPHDYPIEQVDTEKRQIFPDLELIDEEGRKERVSDFKGKVVLISFWATWCAPCLEELPIFAKLAKTTKDELHIIAINQDTDADVKPLIDKLWQEHDIQFKTYYDPGHTQARLAKVEALPTNIVLDRRGRLAFSSYGVFNWTGENAMKLLNELIAEKN